jgi:hypothetical protein
LASQHAAAQVHFFQAFSVGLISPSPSHFDLWLFAAGVPF